MALAGSAVLATTGLADRFIQRPTASSPTSSRTAVATAVADPAAARTARALEQLEAVLNADGRLVAGLAGAQAQTARRASEIAANASSSAGAPSPASGGALPPIPSVSLPSVPALPPMPAASSSAPPPSHAVTGASVVP